MNREPIITNWPVVIAILSITSFFVVLAWGDSISRHCLYDFVGLHPESGGDGIADGDGSFLPAHLTPRDLIEAR